jgi:hypothetical protein
MRDRRFTIPVLVSLLAGLSLYAAAYIFPANFWGINFHTYLPGWVGMAIALAGFVVGYGLPTIPNIPVVAKFPAWVWSLLVALGMWALFYFLYIDTKLYGDSLLILKDLEKGGRLSTVHHFWDAFDPNIFTPKNGEQFSFSLVIGLTKATGLSIYDGFKLLGTILGAVYAFVWMQFIQRKLQGLPMRVLGAGLGLFAGVTQVYYSSAEVYAAPILFFTGYLIALDYFLESRQRKWLFFMLPLLWFAIRSHSAGFTLVPTYLYALLVAVLERGQVTEENAGLPSPWITWRRAGWMMPLGCLAVGIVGYMTAYKAGDDSVEAVRNAGNMFLTVLGTPAPENAYYMLGKWHFWDYFQEFLLCSTLGVVLLLAFVASPDRRSYWRSPSMVAVAMSLILLTALFFAVDPYLTMARDWDLFSLIAPPILVLGVLLLAQAQATLAHARGLLGLAFALVGLQATFIVVNHSKERVHARQLEVAQHIFMSGEVGGSYVVRHTLDALPITPPKRLSALEAQLKILSPYETKVNKPDFGLLYQYGGSLGFACQDYQRALKNYQLAYERLPGRTDILEDLGVVELNLGYFDRALSHAVQAINANSKHSTIWQVGFVAASNLGQQALALQIGDDYLARFGDPGGIAPQIEALRATAPAQGQ